MPLAERPNTDHRVLFVLDSDRPRSQRDIAQAAQLSLGTTNVAIKRLLQKGHLHIDSVNRRKNRYLLTPLGLTEKRQTTLEAALRAVKTFTSLKESLKNELLRAYAAGIESFCVVGRNDLAEWAESVLKELQLSSVRYVCVRALTEVPHSAQAVLLTEPEQEAKPQGRLVLELHNLLPEAALFR